MKRDREYIGVYLMRTILKLACMVSTFLFLLPVTSLHARDEWVSRKFINIKNISKRSWAGASFSLDDDVALHIIARGAAAKNRWFGKAWIINAGSQVIVWEMDFENTERGRTRNERIFDDTVTFPAGDYLVYYGKNSGVNINIGDLEGLLDGIFSGFSQDKIAHRFGISIQPKKAKDLKKIHQFNPDEEDEQAIVQIVGVGNDEHEKRGFSLDQPLEVRIYAIGEGRRRERDMYDYGWIVNDDTRQRVWQMEARKTDHAGGASKNRVIDETITLPAGNYVVHFVTDDSHSYERFNMMPPYDIRHYGITIWAAPGADYRGVVKPYEPGDRRDEIIVDLSHARDHQSYSDGFKLTEPMQIRVYGIGEYSSSGRRMVDYGWIQDARTHEVMWKMTKQNTEHAGGTRRNRMVDTVIDLPRGAYMVYYITDVGHAYRDWNAGPPDDPEAYGLTIWGVDKSFREKVKPYDEQDDPMILARLVEMQNSERRRAYFTLRYDSDIRIYAIGEGDRRGMFDKGWIEDEDGHIVWEMEYEDTRRAGGARKNRLFNDVIFLEKGDYTVYFKTDDTHSFECWNASPPDDPFHWGITLTIED